MYGFYSAIPIVKAFDSELNNCLYKGLYKIFLLLLQLLYEKVFA
jgi:hypothetical protein